MGEPEGVLQERCIRGVPLLKIFVCVGSRPYPFDRLFRELDSLCEQNRVKSNVFAQIGASSYHPKSFPYADYLSPEDFQQNIEEADIVISHGASGSIMTALNAGKRVIAVTRLAKYGEHINDHQVGINETLAEQRLVRSVFEMDELGTAINEVEEGRAGLVPWRNNRPGAVLDEIDRFIQREVMHGGRDVVR